MLYSIWEVLIRSVGSGLGFAKSRRAGDLAEDQVVVKEQLVQSVLQEEEGKAMLTYVLNRGGETSLYEQLYRALRADIESGALAAGARLPSKRAFAKHLGVSVVTVEGALDQLVAEGYVRAVPRSGFYVQEIGPNLASFSRVSTRGDRVQRNLGRSLSSTYHIPLDLDSLNVIS